MEDNSYLPEYGDDDVLSLASGEMFKVGKFRDALKSICIDQGKIPYYIHILLNEKGIGIQGGSPTTKAMLEQGVNGEVLRIGAKGWQKGKWRIRVSLEFSPDEPEISQPDSPLDDIRQMMNQENQQS
ncbi:MAG: hypothetical protein F6K28_29895 [Microcoleus sp. SIO2G3]|nr:hypothetical protein [Microcoleus sp. SIO2G3]